MIEDKLTITVNGAPKQVFLPFGLLNEITKLVGSVDNLGYIMIDPQLREAVISELLAPRDEDGVITKPVNLIVTTISSPDVNTLLEWVSEHVLDFFLTALESSTRVGEKMGERMKGLNLTSSPVGSAS